MNGPAQSLDIITDARSRRSSSWDRSGGNIDCLTDIAPAVSAVLLDTRGPGRVTHIWITVMEYPGHDTVLRDLVLRMYWEDSDTPSVDVPLGDFFGLGHTLPPPFYMDLKYTINSAVTSVGINERAMNCYWPMPFRNAARIEIFNNGRRSLKQLYFHVDYELAEQPAESGLFHAAFRQVRELPTQDIMNLSGADNYVLFETEGRGQYVGCFMYVDSTTGGWWGEGDDMFFIDHDSQPTINGTGTEDYFCNAWCYQSAFTFLYFGCPLLYKRSDGGSYTTMYRFHVTDPIRFSSHIKVTMEHLCGEPETKAYSTVAFWYQDQPGKLGHGLPYAEANHGLRHGEKGQTPPTLPDVDIPALEVGLAAKGVVARTLFAIGQQWLQHGALVIDSRGKEIEIELEANGDGLYRVEVKPVYTVINGTIRLQMKEGSPLDIERKEYTREMDGPYLSLGTVRSTGSKITLVASGSADVPIHKIRLIRLD